LSALKYFTENENIGFEQYITSTIFSLMLKMIEYGDEFIEILMKYIDKLKTHNIEIEIVFLHILVKRGLPISTLVKICANYEKILTSSDKSLFCRNVLRNYGKKIFATNDGIKLLLFEYFFNIWHENKSCINFARLTNIIDIMPIKYLKKFLSVYLNIDNNEIKKSVKKFVKKKWLSDHKIILNELDGYRLIENYELFYAESPN
jgi:hypothetical protein